MLTKKKGSIFNSSAQTIVNPVNTVGIMGAGLALTFKMMYPTMFKQYRSFCKQDKFNLGQLWLYKNSKYWWILNFPTKKHYKDNSELVWIEMGLKNLSKTYKKRGITSLALPYLGCGNGGLNPNDVEKLIEKYLGDLDIPVELWEVDPNEGDIIWNRLFEACYDEDTTFKRIVRNCSSFMELVYRPGIGKDTVGYQVNSITPYEIVL